MLIQALRRYLQHLGNFSRNARLYLLSNVIIALSYSVYMLIFNLYIDSSGYSRSFLGELQSLPSLISLFGTLPASVLVDIIGRKRALLFGNIGRLLAALGIILSPSAGWLRLSMITFGLSGTMWMVSAAPFMMENSTEDERDTLFSSSFGLQTLVGFVGTLVGGYLPTLFGGFFNVPVESASAYRATLGVMALLLFLALIPLSSIFEQARPPVEKGRSPWPWQNIQDVGLVVRIFIPNIVISLGAAILIPYMNLFFKETFRISDGVLGILFAISSVVTGVATLAAPLLAERWGRIRSLFFTQLLSIPFLLIIGFSPLFWVAGIAFWVRAALMNMGNPLYSAFSMSQVEEKERATVSGLMGMSWNIGWAVGPYLSGYMQQAPGIGFKPIFVITCSLYLLAAILGRLFFQKLDDKQRTEALMEKLGVTYIPYESVQ